MAFFILLTPWWEEGILDLRIYTCCLPTLSWVLISYQENLILVLILIGCSSPTPLPHPSCSWLTWQYSEAFKNLFAKFTETSIFQKYLKGWEICGSSFTFPNFHFW